MPAQAMALILAEALLSAQLIADNDLRVYCRAFRVGQPVEEHHVSFVATEEALDDSATPESLSSGITLEVISPDRKSDFALVLNLAGEYYSLDEIAAEQGVASSQEILLNVSVTRVESADGSPFEVYPFLIVPMSSNILRAERLKISFSLAHRSFEGDVTHMEGFLEDVSFNLQRLSD